jgi:hypothetical protein
MQETYVDSAGWFDIEAATGRSIYRLPLTLRERDEGITHPMSLCFIYDDLWVNPCSGGVIGQRDIAVAPGRSLSQVQRSVFDNPIGAAIRKVGDLRGSNVATLQAIRVALDTQVRTAHLTALHGPTDPSSGSIR